MACLACGKQAQDRYCVYHEKALRNLCDHYDSWVRAYGNISWENFLERLEEKNETGAWVKEVIKAELKK
jgi:DNA-directed RNA polymerase subunit N (RpoN/RPB10)